MSEKKWSCKHCNKEFPDLLFKISFCPYCGSEIENSGRQQLSRNEPQKSSEPSNSSVCGKRGQTISGISTSPSDSPQPKRRSGGLESDQPPRNINSTKRNYEASTSPVNISLFNLPELKRQKKAESSDQSDSSCDGYQNDNGQSNVDQENTYHDQDGGQTSSNEVCR